MSLTCYLYAYGTDSVIRFDGTKVHVHIGSMQKYCAHGEDQKIECTVACFLHTSSILNSGRIEKIYIESCGFPEVASAVLLQAIDMESDIVNTEYLSVGTR